MIALYKLSCIRWIMFAAVFITNHIWCEFVLRMCTAFWYAIFCLQIMRQLWVRRIHILCCIYANNKCILYINVAQQVRVECIKCELRMCDRECARVLIMLCCWCITLLSDELNKLYTSAKKNVNLSIHTTTNLYTNLYAVHRVRAATLFILFSAAGYMNIKVLP